MSDPSTSSTSTSPYFAGEVEVPEIIWTLHSILVQMETIASTIQNVLAKLPPGVLSE